MNELHIIFIGGVLFMIDIAVIPFVKGMYSGYKKSKGTTKKL